MKTILVLAQNPELPNAIRSALESHPYRIIHRPDLEEAEPLLKHGALDACLVDADQPQVQAMWVIERLREFAPTLPILVFSTVRSPEWEEMAYLRGVTHVIGKPVRGRLLHSFLARLPGSSGSKAPASSSAPPSRALRVVTVPGPGGTCGPRIDPGGVMDELTRLLPHAYSVADLFNHLLPSLRTSLGVHRAVVFLRQPLPVEGGRSSLDDSRRLHAVAAVGISAKVLQNFELSLDSGIGALLGEPVHLLRRGSDEVMGSPAAQQELDVLGVESVVALMEGQVILGLLGLGSRIDGAPLDPGVVERVFFLAEKAASAVQQIWANERVLANHGMMTDILRELNSACVVVGRDLRILHANKAARRLFLAPADSQAEPTFSDLPQALCSRIYQVLKSGTAVPAFKYRPPDSPNRLFQVTIIPFQSKETLLPDSALLVMEDQTQSEQLKRLEIEAANLRLVKTMADRLAHEIGNALVPVSTHQQLLPTRHKDPEFRQSLETALASSVKRIGRLVNQMVFLAQDRPMSVEKLPVVTLIEEAFREAQRHLPIQTATLKQSNESTSACVSGDREALKHALAEVFLNALQANPSDAKVAVRTHETALESGGRCLRIEIMDNGEGFAGETASQTTEAFFTTRSVGLGLGLTVTRKVIETHQGRLEVIPSEGRRGGLVSISLPIEADHGA
jgi:nitrogen-specific signal transduction histidine kinase/CheY-like chemotaxis protein